jgi:hypothetical protein
MWDPVRLIPLYELWHWVGYFQSVIDTSERLTGKRRDRWIDAMRPRSWGFNSEYYSRTLVRLRLREKEIQTTTYNTKSNHHLEAYLRLTGRDPLSFSRIVEFGGGSGDLARLVLDQGYEGEYVIVDLPQVSRVQGLNFRDYRGHNKPILTASPPAKSPDTLLISTWALSEVDFALRDSVVSTVDPDGWLIAAQRGIFGRDNVAYFSGWDGAREEIEWIRWDGGSYYIAK